MRDRERAAKLLAKASLLPGNRTQIDQLVADEGNCTIRSLRRWRTRLGKDPELTRLYTEERERLQRAESDYFEVARQRLLKLVVESAEAVPAKSPRSLLARTKALAVVVEAQRSEKVLNAWAATLDKPTSEGAEQFTPRVTFEFADGEAEPADDDQVSEVEQAPEASVVNS